MTNGNEIINKETMTSLEIAEVTGKRHDNVVRDIQNILKQGVDALNFEETSYVDKSNRQQKCYSLTKKGCLILASGYDALLRERRASTVGKNSKPNSSPLLPKSQAPSPKPCVSQPTKPNRLKRSKNGSKLTPRRLSN